MEIKQFELADFMILKRDGLVTRGGSWWELLPLLEQKGLVEFCHEDKVRDGELAYNRTEKGKKFYKDTLAKIEEVINGAFGKKHDVKHDEKQQTVQQAKSVKKPKTDKAA